MGPKNPIQIIKAPILSTWDICQSDFAKIAFEFGPYPPCRRVSDGPHEDGRMILSKVAA